MTPQEHMTAKLQTVDLPAKTINVYGQQIVITCYSKEAGEKWISVLARFSKVKGMLKSKDYHKENQRTVLIPSTLDVWRVYATLR